MKAVMDNVVASKTKPSEAGRFFMCKESLFFVRIALWCFGVTLSLFGQSFSGRVGASHDGNQHDHDDIGAAAWDIGIFAKAGARLVHDDYGDHLADNDTAMEHAVERSVLGSAQRFYGSTAMCYNDQRDLQGAINNIAAQINASSATDRFYFILCGPMEVPFRGIMAATAGKRQYCTCISHSSWNDTHTSSLMTHTWTDIQGSGVSAVHIADQNTKLNCTSSSCWDWAKNSGDEKIRFMFACMNGAGVYGDISDAGMAWYVVTGLGDQAGTPALLQAFFQRPASNTPSAINFASDKEVPYAVSLFDVAGSRVGSTLHGFGRPGLAGAPISRLAHNNQVYVIRTRAGNASNVRKILPREK
jgi:hypothetical protein